MKIKTYKFLNKIVLVILGAFLMGIGIGVAMLSTLQADTLALLWEGIAISFNISFGDASIFVAALMLVFPIVRDRSQIGIGTVLAPFILGITSNIVMQLPIATTHLFLQIMMMLFGFMVLSLGVAIYASANLGRSSYDACIFMVADKSRLGIGKLRSIGDLILLVLGVSMGASISIGPIISVFTVGPMIQWFYDKINN